MIHPTRIPRHIHLQRRSFPEEGRHKHKLATPTFWASQSPGFKNKKIINKSTVLKITSKEMRDSSENMTPPATSKLMMVAFMQPLMVEMLVIIIDYQSKLTPLYLDEMQRHFHKIFFWKRCRHSLSSSFSVH